MRRGAEPAQSLARVLGAGLSETQILLDLLAREGLVSTAGAGYADQGTSNPRHGALTKSV